MIKKLHQLNYFSSINGKTRSGSIIAILFVAIATYPVKICAQPGPANISKKGQQAQGAKQLGIAGKTTWMVNPGSRDNLAFVANAGQNDDMVDGAKPGEILYNIDDKGMSVYFTKHGLYYKLGKKVQLSEREWEKYAKEHGIKDEIGDKDEQGKGKVITKTEIVKMDWEGSDSNQVEVSGEDKTSFYFNFYRPDINKDKIIGNVAGYKKLLYKNVYPGIDVEYVIHPEEGIEYSLILHAGADPSVIKMRYSGAKVSLDEKGNIILSTEIGSVTDHAPMSYTGQPEENQVKIQSSFAVTGNSTIGFKLNGDQSPVKQTTVIDPWTVGPGLTNFSTCIPEDIAVDGTAAHNVLINGNTYTSNTTNGQNMTQSYTSAGVLSWTLNMWTKYEYDNPGMQGDVQADNSGNVYLCPGLAYNSHTGGWYNTICVNSTGTTLLWGSTKANDGTNNMFEVWTLTFDCARDSLYQSGGGLYDPSTMVQPEYNFPASEEINMSTGAESVLYSNNNFGEIVSSNYAPNGLIYQLTADSNLGGLANPPSPYISKGQHNYIIVVNPVTGAIIASSPTGYLWDDGSYKNGFSTGYNGVAASCYYAYSTNGLWLDQRTLSTGALVNRVTIPGGDSIEQPPTYNSHTDDPTTVPANVNSGIAFDSCGDVYVGSDGVVYEYDENLNPIATISGLPGTVFDMAVGEDQHLYVTGGGTNSADAFVAQVSLSTCTGLPVSFTPVTCSSPNSGTATANPQFTGPPFTYLWSNGQTTQTATGLSAGTYTVTVTGAPQCPAVVYVETATVTIPPSAGAPTASITSSTNPTCTSTGSATVTASGGTPGYTYSWSPGGITTNNASGLSAGAYTVTVTDAGGCTATATVTLTAPAPPTITASASPTSVCAGTPSTLNAGGGVSYTWAPNTGLSATTGSSVTATPGTSQTYTVTGTDINGCVNTQTVTLTVNPLPTITASAAPTNVCVGTSSTLTAAGGVTYAWSPSTGLSATTGTSVTATPGSTQTYTVTGTDGNGCTNIQTVVLTINPLPTITASSSPAIICPGGSSTLTAGGGVSYTWSPATGLSNTTGSAVTSIPATTTTYTVTGTDGNGCTNMQTVTVNVDPTPTITVTPPSSGICPGGSVALTASGAVTYTWSPAGGLSCTTCSNPVANPGSTQTYTVTGTDAAGCTHDTTITITVGGISVTGTATDPSICSGSSTTLTASGATTYTWTPAVSLSATTGTTVTANPAVSTTYTLVGSSGAGCTDTTTVAVTVNPLPSVGVSSLTPTICPGGTAVLNSSGAVSYTWSPAIGLSATTGASVNASPGSTQTYIVTGTDANGCTNTASITINVTNITVVPSASSTSICDGSSTTLTATGATNYTWSPATGLSATTGSPVIANPNTTTLYSVVGTTGTCKDSVTISVTVNPLPTITASAAPNNICAGASSTLTAGGGVGYTWSPSTGLSATTGSSVTATPSSTQTYTVTGIDANGCDSTTTVTVIVNPTPTVTISLSGNDTLCPSQSITLTANGATSYVWSTGSTINPITISSAGTYSVIGSNGVCADTAIVVIHAYPALTVNVKNDTICSGGNGQIMATASGGNGVYTYVWNNGLGTGAGPFNVNPSTSTYYDCTVTDGCGTTVKDSGLVLVAPSAVAAFKAVPDTVMGGGVVSFVNASTGASSYFWNFGNGTTSVDTFPSVQYGAAGDYMVILVVSNGKGCVDTAWEVVYVTEGIIVPNVFTPNGDGQNDVFHITAGGMQTYEIEIFNRWGEKMFQSNSPSIDWSGKTSAGLDAPDGTYYYIIKATDYKAKQYDFDGYLELIR